MSNIAGVGDGWRWWDMGEMVGMGARCGRDGEMVMRGDGGDGVVGFGGEGGRWWRDGGEIGGR